MLKNGEYHRDRNAPLHEVKILHYRKFPDKRGIKYDKNPAKPLDIFS